jgi:hypothetical protein
LPLCRAGPGRITPELSVAVFSGDPEQIGALSADSVEDRAILAVKAERIMYALDDSFNPPVPPEGGFLPMRGGTLQLDQGALRLEAGSRPSYFPRGHCDAVVSLINHLLGGPAVAEAGVEAIAETFVDETVSTCGLRATKVVRRFRMDRADETSQQSCSSSNRGHPV